MIRKPKESLGENRIKEILLAKGMTRNELSEKTGIDTSHLSKIISNKRKQISLPIAHKIAVGLGETIENVFIKSDLND